MADLRKLGFIGTIGEEDEIDLEPESSDSDNEDTQVKDYFDIFWNRDKILCLNRNGLRNETTHVFLFTSSWSCTYNEIHVFSYSVVWYIIYRYLFITFHLIMKKNVWITSHDTGNLFPNSTFLFSFKPFDS